MKLYLVLEGGCFTAYDPLGHVRYSAQMTEGAGQLEWPLMPCEGPAVAAVLVDQSMLGRKYTVVAGGGTVARLYRAYDLMPPILRCEKAGWRVCGSLRTQEFSLSDAQGNAVMDHRRCAQGPAGAFEVEIVNPADEPVCLGIALAVDDVIALSHGAPVPAR